MILSLILLADNFFQEIVAPAFFPARQNNGQDGHRIGACGPSMRLALNEYLLLCRTKVEAMLFLLRQTNLNGKVSGERYALRREEL